MANSSRDPYWQASVRRETMEHAVAGGSIEDECAVCHMPIPRYEAKLSGHAAAVFAHLPLQANRDRKASDGVSCSVCHQITPENLGTTASFNGQFVIGSADSRGAHAEFGPFDIDPGLMQVMRTSTDGYQPTQGDQIRTSELCASCHTLITKALGPDGAVIGSLPEQVPYQEWLHSEYRDQRTCQSCHMPAVRGTAPISRVLGAEREGVARHEFVAANFMMQRVFSRYHDDLAAAASSEEFAAAADRTVSYLRSQAARLSVAAPRIINKRLQADVTVENLGGHKLPTGFPSRRAWLHVTVRDSAHRVIFESGALNADGSIQGNANDTDPSRYEPHYSEIREPDQVQVYESILQDAKGAVTTGLLSAVGYVKDNRLLPHGFEKTTATADIAVHGGALTDQDFTGRGQRLRYSVDAGGAAGPFEVEAQLWYQPIGYRWAQNLKAYNAREIQRFTGYFEAEGAASATLLATAVATSQ
jgi:cytochrome c551/c552